MSMFGTMRSVAVIDPFSSGAVLCSELLADCLVYRLLSRVYPEQQLKFIPKGLSLNFTETILISNLEETASYLKKRNVSAVVPGCEAAVELSDQLSEILQLDTSNGTDKSASRRDKFLMQEQLHNNGLRSIKRLLIDPSTDWTTIVDFVTSLPVSLELGTWEAVVKPTRSCGTDNVTYCTNIDEIKLALSKIIGSENQLGSINNAAVLQEYLKGVEHVVDCCSYHGIHKTLAVWQYHKIEANGGKFVYSGMKLLEPSVDSNSLFFKLVNYNNKALDVLGISNGASHSEIMMLHHNTSVEDLNEPCLIEVGARLHGVKGSFVTATNACIGYNQINIAKSVYTDRVNFYRIPDIPPKLLKQGMQVFLISSVSGVVEFMPLLDKITSRPSFAAINIVEIGDSVYPTINGWTSPGNVTLVHEDDRVVQEDYEYIVQLVKSLEFFVLKGL